MFSEHTFTMSQLKLMLCYFREEKNQSVINQTKMDPPVSTPKMKFEFMNFFLL